MTNIRMSSARELKARWDEYRTERHRQEVELENQTGGYAGDIADYHARGGPQLITFKDWLKGQGGEKAKAEAEYGPVTHEVHTPDPNRWGDPNEAPPW